MKTLLIYPNCEGYGRIPLSLSILSACLKKHGHDVKLFDLTFMVSSNIDNEMREKIGTAKKVDSKKYWGEVGGIDIHQELRKTVQEFQPDLVGVSLIQNNYWTSMDLLKEVKTVSDAPVVVGGVFASALPGLLLESGLIDIVVIGEGENALIELAKRIEEGKDYRDIQNLAVLKNGKVHRNPLGGYTDLNKLPFQDFSIFDERHLMKPFDGKMRRSGYVELSRGCPYSCTYCANYFLNETLYCNERVHIRFKDVDYCVAEVKALHEQYQFELILFADENMLVLPLDKLKRFAELWKKEVNVPFYVTTRVEMAKEEKIAILKDMGCVTVAFGIEAGNEQYRRKILKRGCSNQKIIDAFHLCKKYGIRTTANSMFGLPYETEALIFDTIKLNMEAQPDSFSISIFAPYIGTRLHEVCVKEGFVEEGIPSEISMIDNTILEMPQISKERVLELYMDFMKYFNGELEIPEQFREYTDWKGVPEWAKYKEFR